MEGDIRCNYLECAAGLGVAGNRKCFLGGDFLDKNCDKFIFEESFIDENENIFDNE